VVDLKEPKLGAGRDDQGDGHDHGQDNHDQANHGHDDSHDDEALVARFVRSSLDIALPRIEKRDSDGRVTQTKSALLYGGANSSIVLDGTTSSPILAPNASSSMSVTSNPAVLPPAVLPAFVQEELNTKLSNYLTWDKKLYANLPLDSNSIRLVEIRPGSSHQVEVDLIKRPLDEVKNAYEALSYTWGSPSPKETIVVNGVQVQINQWLFGALSSLRLPNAKRCLWVDAICIYVFRRRDSCRRFWRHRPPETAVFLATFLSESENIFSFTLRATLVYHFPPNYHPKCIVIP
jgi:hypothetical protein